GDISARAKKLHFSSIVVDTHDDTTQRFLDGKFDIAERHDDGSIDLPRMREGGLDAIFFSIWIPSKVTGTEAVNRAIEQIEAVREQVLNHPKELALNSFNLLDSKLKLFASRFSITRKNS